jgi:DnaA family protein
VFEVQELGDEAKAAALVARAARRGIELRDEVLQFILARNTRSMHDLALLLDRLDHSALAEQRRVTVPFVKSVMGW